MAEPQPQPLVCVFLKLPPSHRPVSRMYEIAWHVFLPQLNRINEAFEAAQATRPSSEAKKLWVEARGTASEKMVNLQDVTFTTNNTAYYFLQFLDALHSGSDISKPHQSFRSAASNAIKEAGTAQEGMLEFREEIRIVVDRITNILSNDGRDVSSFVTESSQSLLELATGVEECNAILEEHREEFKTVQRQSSDEKSNPPSEEEIRVVQEKWRSFKEITGSDAYRWQVLKRKMRGPEDSDEPVTTSDNPTNPRMPADFSKTHRIPFWRKCFRRISSCLSAERFVR